MSLPNHRFIIFPASLLLGACAMMPPGESTPEVEPVAEQAPLENTELTDANKRVAELEFRNRQLREELASLELQSIDTNTQLAQLRERFQRLSRAHDDAVAEVVRSQAKLQGNVSQADAAANIAEAEIALSERANSPEVAQARALLASASLQFDEGNYGGALYLSNQSKRVLASAQPVSLMLPPQEGERRFTELLNLWVTLHSNLRAGPGLNHEIVRILEVGTPLRAYSYDNAWVRVILEDGSDGWIFQTLVSQSPPQPPSS